MYRPRFLDWPECLNARDLGGLPLGDGSRVRTGALIRSDNLDRLTVAGVAAVRSAGVSRIVDVRTPRECEVYPNPFTGDPIRLNRPVNSADEPDESMLSLAEQYVATLERNAPGYAAAIQAIADAPAGCVVVHCHAGKDRTGMVVALALAAVGADPEVVAGDYAVVGVPDVVRLVGGSAPTAAALPELEASKPETMLAVLEHVQHHYGGVPAFLTGAGLATDRIEALHARLCTT